MGWGKDGDMWIFSDVCVHAFVNTCLPVSVQYVCVCMCKLGHVSTPPVASCCSWTVMASWGNQKRDFLDSSPVNGVSSSG